MRALIAKIQPDKVVWWCSDAKFLAIFCIPYFHRAAQLRRAVSSQLRHLSTIGKKLVKQQHLPYMTSQHGELHPTNGWVRFVSLGHSSKFQRVAHLVFVTAATALTGGQPNFARCLAISYAGTLYIYIFGGSCLRTEFCWVQNSLYVQLLHSPILPALLHGTPPASVSQAFRCGTRNGITELSQRASPMFRWAAITLGIGPHSSFNRKQKIK